MPRRRRAATADEKVVGQVAIERLRRPSRGIARHRAEPGRIRIRRSRQTAPGQASAGPSARQTEGSPAADQPAARRHRETRRTGTVACSSRRWGQTESGRMLSRRKSVGRSASEACVLPFIFEPGQDESVDRIARPRRFFNVRNRRPLWWCKRPVLRHRRRGRLKPAESA